MGELYGFLWVMLALKIPLAMLLYVVWWAIKAQPEPVSGNGEGGTGDRAGGPHRPPRPGPSNPRRRGPHGEAAVPPPPRTRPRAPARDATRAAHR